MLNALAIGARELASMAIPESAARLIADERTNFPSKKLPPHLHRKYITAQSQGTEVVQKMLDGINRAAIDRGESPREFFCLQ
jgi:telomere length regulation protein